MACLFSPDEKPLSDIRKVLQGLVVEKIDQVTHLGIILHSFLYEFDSDEIILVREVTIDILNI